MELKPYWALQNVEKIGLTECMSSCPLQPLENILETKREVAGKACAEILKKDPEAEVVALLGSVAHGDIVGWFSDIDMLVITGKPREEEMVEVDHDVLFVEYHSWTSFRDLVVKKIAREEYESRSSYLFFYGNPYYLHSSAGCRAKYRRIVEAGIEALWEAHSQVNEYLDDFIWFYGAAKEALRYGQRLTAMGKLQRGTILLLRHYLVKNRILIRKPLPDDRTMVQLRRSQIPKELVEFIEQLYKGNLDTTILLRNGREMYLQVTNKRRWVNKIPL